MKDPAKTKRNSGNGFIIGFILCPNCNKGYMHRCSGRNNLCYCKTCGTAYHINRFNFDILFGKENILAVRKDNWRDVKCENF